MNARIYVTVPSWEEAKKMLEEFKNFEVELRIEIRESGK